MSVSFPCLLMYILIPLACQSSFFQCAENFTCSIPHTALFFSRVVLDEKRTTHLKFQTLFIHGKKNLQLQPNAEERKRDHFNITQKKQVYIYIYTHQPDMMQHLMGTTINLLLLSKKSHHCQPSLAKGNEIHLQMKNNFLFFNLIEETIAYCFSNNFKQNS